MEIEKNIPVPRAYAAREKYPFHQMEIGDSFVVPVDRGVAASVACSWYKKKHGMKFVTRKTKDGKFVRVWRIA